MLKLWHRGLRNCVFKVIGPCCRSGSAVWPEAAHRATGRSPWPRRRSGAALSPAAPWRDSDTGSLGSKQCRWHWGRLRRTRDRPPARLTGRLITTKPHERTPQNQFSDPPRPSITRKAKMSFIFNELTVEPAHNVPLVCHTSTDSQAAVGWVLKRIQAFTRPVG